MSVRADHMSFVAKEILPGWFAPEVKPNQYEGAVRLTDGLRVIRSRSLASGLDCTPTLWAARCMIIRSQSPDGVRFVPMNEYPDFQKDPEFPVDLEARTLREAIEEAAPRTIRA